ncbi:MAG: hypothetical protein JW959_12940 [Pirellulales bacterium]|nr:hypothetical protein [Pirellulales bacterium]
MRRITIVFLILCLAAPMGCAHLTDYFFSRLAEKHYTDGATPQERRSRFEAERDRWRRWAEDNQQ